MIKRGLVLSILVLFLISLVPAPGITTESSCTDSDGGKVFSIKGKVVF